MKIFYINVIEQNAGWGAEEFVNRGFRNLGQETINLDYRVHRQHLAEKFLEIEDFDVLFLQRGDGFPTKLLRAVKRPKVFWASELVSRCRDQDELLASGLFEHVYVHSVACKQTIVENRWLPEEKVSVLLNGFDETVQYQMPGVEKDIDVLFVGNILPRRREWLDKIKEHFPVTEAKAFGREMTELVNRSKLVLNIHAEGFPDTETRIFEVLGCGSFVLTEKLSLESPFKSGEHLVEVDSLEEMLEQIGYYLSHSAERVQIARQGYQEALAKHTYTRRAAELMELFQALPQKRGTSPMDRDAVRLLVRSEQLDNSWRDVRHRFGSIKRKIFSLGRTK